MLRTILARFPKMHILVYPVNVQGEGAAEEIAAAVVGASSACTRGRDSARMPLEVDMNRATICSVLVLGLWGASAAQEGGRVRERELRKLNSSDPKILPFQDAEFLLTSSSWGSGCRLVFDGPITRDTDLTKPTPWRLIVTFRQNEDELEFPVLPPDELNDRRTEPGKGNAHVAVVELSQDSEKPRFWAAEGKIILSSFETFRHKNSRIDDFRFEATFELQVQEVDRSKTKPELKGAKVKLTGTFKIDTEQIRK